MAQKLRKSMPKKDKKTVPTGVVHIQSTFNNTIVTITNLTGDTISWASAGSAGFKGARKGTPFAAQTAAEKAAVDATTSGLKSVEIRVKGQGSGRETAIRAIQSAGFDITAIQDITPVPHNGCRAPKREAGVLYGQFLINTLRTGQGITIGNLFRRILLGDLSGTTITAVRIAGVNNEFSIIEGVREDVLEFLLNLKGIVIKGKLPEVQFGKLKIQEPMVITANQIELPEGLEIINPNHYIATTSTYNLLEIELKFETGIGYNLASQTFSEQSEDFLQMDSIFMPVQKVDFKTENISDKTNERKESLIIDIWTNGSISPEGAIYEASQIIVDIFSSILKNKFTDEIKSLNKQESSNTIDPHTNIAIEELQLSVRAYNCLKRAQINTVGDLLKYSPEKLQELKNFGRKSADEVFVTLKNKLGIILK